jgi:two-component system sensor histidine kinase PilS (NtrC family)
VGSGRSLEEDVTLGQDGLGPHRVHVRTRLAAPQDTSGESLCVLFLQDQREMEARMRTEKLASMGRMSTAVAHEVRNPLAAIAQANALLDEDLSDPRLKKLTAMISQNARRLGKIVDDVLNVTHIQPSETGANAPALPLQETCARIGKDWATQNGCEQRLSMMLTGAPICVRFDSDHLRRVLVNLLDNAARHASTRPHGIQMDIRDGGLRAELSVWSDGAPMDQSVERHLFEPFFSSSSRSSGLGLYICRQLCDNHGATIAYHRGQRLRDGEPVEGNEFTVAFSPAPPEQVSNQTNLNRDSPPWQTSPP